MQGLLDHVKEFEFCADVMRNHGMACRQGYVVFTKATQLLC